MKTVNCNCKSFNNCKNNNINTSKIYTSWRDDLEIFQCTIKKLGIIRFLLSFADLNCFIEIFCINVHRISELSIAAEYLEALKCRGGLVQWVKKTLELVLQRYYWNLHISKSAEIMKTNKKWTWSSGASPYASRCAFIELDLWNNFFSDFYESVFCKKILVFFNKMYVSVQNKPCKLGGAIISSGLLALDVSVYGLVDQRVRYWCKVLHIYTWRGKKLFRVCMSDWNVKIC